MARHSNFDKRIDFMKMLQARRRRHVLKTCLISCIHQRRQTLLKISALLMLLFTSSESTNEYHKPRLCRRLICNIGWWDIVWCSYSEARFRKTFRVSRETFMYILSFLRNDLEKQTITEVPISPECRLAICLYRLGRGDYYYTISEMVGVGLNECGRKVSVHTSPRQKTCLEKRFLTWTNVGNSLVAGQLLMVVIYL